MRRTGCLGRGRKGSSGDSRFSSGEAAPQARPRLSAGPSGHPARARSPQRPPAPRAPHRERGTAARGTQRAPARRRHRAGTAAEAPSGAALLRGKRRPLRGIAAAGHPPPALRATLPAAIAPAPRYRAAAARPWRRRWVQEGEKGTSGGGPAGFGCTGAGGGGGGPGGAGNGGGRWCPGRVEGTCFWGHTRVLGVGERQGQRGCGALEGEDAPWSCVRHVRVLPLYMSSVRVCAQTWMHHA